MSCADRLPGKQFLFCYRELKIMCTDQQLCHPILHRNTSILKHSEQVVSRIHQRAEKKIVKIIVGLLCRLLFKSPESHRICLREDDPRRLRTGERQRDLPHPLKFLDMPRISAAGITEHPGSRLDIHITEIFFI